MGFQKRSTKKRSLKNSTNTSRHLSVRLEARRSDFFVDSPSILEITKRRYPNGEALCFKLRSSDGSIIASPTFIPLTFFESGQIVTLRFSYSDVLRKSSIIGLPTRSYNHSQNES